MNIFSKRNIVIPGPSGEKFRIKKDLINPVPDWAAKTPYFQALQKDKKIIVTAAENTVQVSIPASDASKGKKRKNSPKAQEPQPKKLPEDEPSEDEILLKTVETDPGSEEGACDEASI